MFFYRHQSESKTTSDHEIEDLKKIRNFETGCTHLRPEVPLKFTILRFQRYFWRRVPIYNELLKYKLFISPALALVDRKFNIFIRKTD